VAWLRASVVRFANGATHTRRRALVEAELAALDLAALRTSTGQGPVEILAEALGLPVDTADVALVAACYQPQRPITVEADQAVARLVAGCGGTWDEVTANRIALLVQAGAATEALVANIRAGRDEAPIPATRRVAPDGAEVEVSLADVPFGAGPHACPGRAHALAIAEALSQSTEPKR
jgi:cytochrome P450